MEDRVWDLGSTLNPKLFRDVGLILHETGCPCSRYSRFCSLCKVFAGFGRILGRFKSARVRYNLTRILIHLPVVYQGDSIFITSQNRGQRDLLRVLLDLESS